MTEISKKELDPFRAIIGVLVGLTDSDLLTTTIATTGLRFDLSLTESENYSHKKRVRAYQPRIIGAYDLLDDQDKLAVADAVLTTLIHKQDGSLPHIKEILERIGWDISNGRLIASSPDLREMFFPKGSQWDAFVVLRDLISKAQTELIVVDSYCDGTVFQMLGPSNPANLRIRILCSKNALAVATEGKAFIAQYSSVAIEVRQSKDFHNRFVVIDGQSCIHIGASIKDAGRTTFMISQVEDQENKDGLLMNIETCWKAANIIL